MDKFFCRNPDKVLFSPALSSVDEKHQPRRKTHLQGIKKNKKPSGEGLNNVIPNAYYYFFEPCSSETLSLWRPFALRLAKTLRPFAVDIRSRKP